MCVLSCPRRSKVEDVPAAHTGARAAIPSSPVHGGGRRWLLVGVPHAEFVSVVKKDPQKKKKRYAHTRACSNGIAFDPRCFFFSIVMLFLFMVFFPSFTRARQQKSRVKH